MPLILLPISKFICLKTPKGYKGEVFWGLGKEKFSYLIDKNGLIDLNESHAKSNF